MPDRAKLALRALVEKWTSKLLYAVPRRARVVRQRADGTLELQVETVDSNGRFIDHPDIPNPVAVPARYGIPSTTTKVQVGGRCVLIFVDADPKFPIVISWQSDALVDEIKLADDGGSGPRTVVREGDVVTVGDQTSAIAITGPKSKVKAG